MVHPLLVKSKISKMGEDQWPENPAEINSF